MMAKVCTWTYPYHAELISSIERIYFPFLNKKLDFSGEASAHKVIHEKLDQLFEYVTASEKDESHFYAAQMKSMMEELRQPLVNLSADRMWSLPLTAL